MPQLDSGGGGAGAGDDLGAPDELLAFQDEGEEQDDKNRDSAAGPERDLAELKSSLVNESEGAAAGAGVPGPGVRVPGEAEGAPEVSPARTSPEDPVPSWYRADPPPRPPRCGPRGSHLWSPSCSPPPLMAPLLRSAGPGTRAYFAATFPGQTSRVPRRR